MLDVVKLTRRLVDIESISGNEAAVGEALLAELQANGLDAERMQVETNRFNVLAVSRGSKPQLFFSTHMDVVPPFIPSSEDENNVYGRGACDAKGIIAAMTAASLQLREQNIQTGLLFVVGEERDSLGAKTANQQAPAGVKFLINGEPTENRLATSSKGVLRVEIVAQGRMAHSAYPELGESAIDKLLEALNRLRQVELPKNPEVGPTTVNIGIIEGGRAPNVIPDFAKAHLLYRLVGPAEKLKTDIVSSVGQLARVDFVLEFPFLKLRTMDGFPTMVASFTTDIPALRNWGEPLLLGPGSIHVAHTEREFVSKKELHQAVELYCSLAKRLLAG